MEVGEPFCFARLRELMRVAQEFPYVYEKQSRGRAVCPKVITVQTETMIFKTFDPVGKDGCEFEIDSARFAPIGVVFPLVFKPGEFSFATFARECRKFVEGKKARFTTLKTVLGYEPLLATAHN